jgi:type II secretory pathway pseudopilin PulG
MIETTSASSASDQDEGLGLIELIVAIVVSTIVLVAVATILGNGWMTQTRVLSTSEATNRGQLIGSSIETAMRNALDFEVRAATVPAATGTELWVHTSFDDERRCQAFRLDNHIAQVKMSTDDLASATWGTWLAEDSTRGWQALVVQSDSTPFFEDVSFLQPTIPTVVYAFDVETDGAPVSIRGEASARTVDGWGSAPCWG